MRGILWLPVSLWVASCGVDGPPPSPDVAAPLPYLELLTGGAADGEELPMVVALHGRGDTPERFRTVFEHLETPARVIVLEAPIDEGDGRAWFHFRMGFDDAMDQLAHVAPRVVRTVRVAAGARPTRGAPVVTGFSQGGMIAYELALEHPTAFGAAFPVSGVLPRRFLPRDGAASRRLPPIIAFHGADDHIISAASDRASQRPLRALGADVRYHEVAGTRHWITAAMRSALFAAIDAHFAGLGASPH